MSHYTVVCYCLLLFSDVSFCMLSILSYYFVFSDVEVKASMQALAPEKRCLSCWQHEDFTVHRCVTELDHKQSNIGAAVPCHYIKGPFSHTQGQVVDNSSLLLQRLALLYNNEVLSDITVVVGDKRFYAHKLILCSSSEIFKIMLTNECWSDSGKQCIVLTEEEPCVDVFDIFLHYFYSAVIHLSHDSVLPVLMLADKYDVIDLQILCCDYMISHLVSTVSENQAVSWYEYGLLANHTALAEQCEHFIMWNFRKIASTKHFYDMRAHTLQHFIQSSDLVIQDEYTLFQILAKWLRHSSPEQLLGDAAAAAATTSMEELDVPVRVARDDALALLSCVRFPMMPPQHLVQLQQEPLARFYSDFFIGRIELAMRLHYVTDDGDERQQQQQRRLLTKRHGILQADEEHLIRSRCYTDDTWCTTVNIEDYNAVKQYSVLKPVTFSSPISAAQVDENRGLSWELSVYPKGVQHDKFVIVSLLRHLQGPSASLDVFRLMLKSNDKRQCTVDVSVLLFGAQDNVEYVKKLYSRRCIFDQQTTAYNLDDVAQLCDLNGNVHSPYFVGKSSDAMKLSIIIKPV